MGGAEAARGVGRPRCFAHPGQERTPPACEEDPLTTEATFAAAHVERSGEFVVPLPLGEAFPLFTPEGERAYVPGWEPEYLHPSEPSDAAGTVFRTRAEGEETLWIVLEHDPAAGVAAYGRFTPGSRLGTVRVRCVAEGERRTRVTVTYAMTATSPHGNEALDRFDAAALEAKLDGWREAIVGLAGRNPGR